MNLDVIFLSWLSQPMSFLFLTGWVMPSETPQTKPDMCSSRADIMFSQTRPLSVAPVTETHKNMLSLHKWGVWVGSNKCGAIHGLYLLTLMLWSPKASSGVISERDRLTQGSLHVVSLIESAWAICTVFEDIMRIQMASDFYQHAQYIVYQFVPFF